MKRAVGVAAIVIGLSGCDVGARIKADGMRVERELQRELRYTQLANGGAPLIADQPTIAEYVLTLEDPPVGDPYFFDLKRYVIATGGDLSQIPTASLCKVMDGMFEQKTPLAEALKEVEAGLEFNAGPFGFSLGTKAAPVVEIWYVLKRFAAIRDSKVLIAIRGYADGQHSAWSDTLLGPPYDYNKIAVLPPVDPKSLNPVSFFLRDSIISIPSRSYTNSMLPDLRAEFVRRELIMPFLQRCGEFNTDVRVIKGFEYSAPDRPERRKVQVFIYLLKN